MKKHTTIIGIAVVAGALASLGCQQQQPASSQTAMPGGPVCLGAEMTAQGTCVATQSSIGVPVSPASPVAPGAATPNTNATAPLVGGAYGSTGVTPLVAANQPAAAAAPAAPAKMVSADAEANDAESYNIDSGSGVPLPTYQDPLYSQAAAEPTPSRAPASIQPAAVNASAGTSAAPAGGTIR